MLASMRVPLTKRKVRKVAPLLLPPPFVSLPLSSSLVLFSFFFPSPYPFPSVSSLLLLPTSNPRAFALVTPLPFILSLPLSLPLSSPSFSLPSLLLSLLLHHTYSCFSWPSHKTKSYTILSRLPSGPACSSSHAKFLRQNPNYLIFGVLPKAQKEVFGGKQASRGAQGE
jgi:hypothetical protein